MDVAYISALSALAGSVVGGLTSGITTWLNQRVQARAERLAHNKSLREDLYKDFIIAASKAYGNAIVSNEPQIQELVALYAIISRMRMLSSPRIVACADKIMGTTIDTFFVPNKTISELQELIRSGAAIDPLKDFGKATRGTTDVLTIPERLSRRYLLGVIDVCHGEIEFVFVPVVGCRNTRCRRSVSTRCKGMPCSS